MVSLRDARRATWTLRADRRRVVSLKLNDDLHGRIGAVCMFPLRAIISASVALGIHPNVLTLIGVLVNVVGGLGAGRRPLRRWPA